MKFSSLSLRLSRFRKSWSSVSAFTTFIFSCWKRAWKSAQRFLYTFSIHAIMFHWTLKRNSNLYYSITTQTGQPPKLLKRFWAWNYSLTRWTVLSFIQQLINPSCCTNLWSWSLDCSRIHMNDSAFWVLWRNNDSGYQCSPNGQMGWCICIPNSQTADWSISWKTAWWFLREEGRICNHQVSEVGLALYCTVSGSN